MFKGFSLSLLAAGVLAASAQGSGVVAKVYDCRGGAGEDAASVKVNFISVSAPGGPVSSHHEAQLGASWFGGTHDSGAVKVTHMIAADGGPTAYVNKDAQFGLYVHGAEMNKIGKLLRIDVSADFVDPKTKMKGSIRRRWLPCR